MNGMVRLGPYRTTLQLVAVAAALVHLAVMLRLSGWEAPQGIGGWIQLAWGPVASAVTAVATFHFAFEKWLWRARSLRGKLVNFPDLSGTWYAVSRSITYGGAMYYGVVTIEHRFDRIICTLWRLDGEANIVCEAVSEACTLQKPEANDRTHMFVVYESSAGLASPEQGSYHGCARVALLNETAPNETWRMAGKYWTDSPWQPGGAPGPGATRGTMEMYWKHADPARALDEDARQHLLKGSRPGGPAPAAQAAGQGETA